MNIYFHYYVLVTALAVQAFPSDLNAERPLLSFQAQSVLKKEERISVIIRLSQRFVADGEYSRNIRNNRAVTRNRLVRELRTHGQTRRTAFLRWVRQVDPDARELWHIHAITATLPAEFLSVLERHPDVAQVTRNAQIPLSVDLAGPPSGPDGWNLDLIAARQLWLRGYSGQGIVVATVDTGVDLHHPAVQRSWRGGANSWFDAFGESDRPVDSLGHGTQVMGIICGGDDLGTPIGVAPRCTWIAARIFQHNSSADLVGIHRALQWLLDPDNDPNTPDQPDIVNNSWGLTDRPGECIPEFREDIALLNAAGMIVIFAAGNSGPAPGSGVSPANYPEVLSVGAVDPGMSVSSYSSRGPGGCNGGLFPSLVAPGTDILTCDLTLGGIFPSSRTYAIGTSFAAAHVTGAAAALLSAFPLAGSADIRSVLLGSAKDLGVQGPDDDSGYGLLDMDSAFRSLLAAHLTADLNQDRVVDLQDLPILVEQWMQTQSDGESWTSDLCPDGVIDLQDFHEFARQYGGNFHE